QVAAPAIAGLVHLGDEALALDAGRRGDQLLRQIAVDLLPLARLVDGRAAAAAVTRIFGDLLEDEVAHRDHLQPLGGTGPGDLVETAGEAFEGGGRGLLVAGVLGRNAGPDPRRGVDRRLQLDAIVFDRLLARRQHRQHRGGGAVDDEAEPADADF